MKVRSHLQEVTPLTRYFLIACLLFLASCGGTPSNQSNNPPSSKDTVVEIPTGGSITIPEGGLPSEANVEVTETETPPLPTGIEAIGKAIRISTDQAITQPAFLRLPVPAGTDPDKLVLFRIEDDGTTTILGTRTENNELLAATPAFRSEALSSSALTTQKTMGNGSNFIPGIIEDVLSDPNVPVVSPDNLIIDSFDTFYLDQRASFSLPREVQSATWQISKEFFSIVADDVPRFRDTNAIKAGKTTISVSYIDEKSGLPGFTAKQVSILNELIPAELIRILPPAYDNTWIVGQQNTIGIGAIAQGDDLLWSWNLGDGTLGEQKSGPSLEIQHTFEEAGTYNVEVKVQQNQAKGATSFLIHVREPGPQVNIQGPPKRSLDSSNSINVPYSAVFDTSCGGFSWQATWKLFPGGESQTSSMNCDIEPDPDNPESFPSTETIMTFREPGTYLLQVEVESDEGNVLSDLLMVTILGAPLSGNLTVEPEELDVFKTVKAKLQIKDGVTVAAGQKKPYKVTIDWGDGETTSSEVPSLSGIGSQKVFEHFYKVSGTYTIKATIRDAFNNPLELSDKVKVNPSSSEPVITDLFVNEEGELLVDLPYLFTSLAEGGTLPYTWSITPTPFETDLVADTSIIDFKLFFTQKGGQDVCVSVTDSAGAQSEEKCITVVVGEKINEWVLTSTKENPEGKPEKLNPYETNASYDGSFAECTFANGTITTQYVIVINGVTENNYRTSYAFDTPPAVVEAEDSVSLDHAVSASGFINSTPIPGGRAGFLRDGVEVGGSVEINPGNLNTPQPTEDSDTASIRFWTLPKVVDGKRQPLIISAVDKSAQYIGFGCRIDFIYEFREK